MMPTNAAKKTIERIRRATTTDEVSDIVASADVDPDTDDAEHVAEAARDKAQDLST